MFGAVYVFYHEVERQQFLGKQRRADVKAGKGAAVAACGVARGEGVLKELALKYVEAKEAVQVTYQKRKNRDEAVARFREGGVDLLLLDEDGSRLSVGELQAWRSVLLGKMALGVIVHPENNLKALTLADLRQIAHGEVTKWPAGSEKAAAIRAYGLPTADPMMLLFKEKVVGQHRAIKIAAQADTAKVVLAVARDPAGIGFVDLSQMPRDDKSVKLLPITTATIPQPPIAPDTKPRPPVAPATIPRPPIAPATKPRPPVAPERLPDDYPLAQPYVLYISADASKAARDLADYLAANPNAELFAQHRLLPPPALNPAGAIPKGKPLKDRAAAKPTEVAIALLNGGKRRRRRR